MRQDTRARASTSTPQPQLASRTLFTGDNLPVLRRMERELGGLVCEVVHRTDLPERTDQGKIADYRTHKHQLYGRQEGRCEGCRIYFPYPNLTVDHVLARVKGGTDHLSNLQLLCGACNSIKGPRSMDYLRSRLAGRDRLESGAGAQSL